MHQRDCEGSSGPRNFVDNPEQRSPVIMCSLGYNLRGVDISNPALRKTSKALKKHKFDNENYANEAIQISDLNNLKSVHPIWRGAFQVKDKVLKVNNNVNVYAYLSTAASEEVKNFSKSSLPRVVEVEKVPRSKVWPKTRRSPRTIVASIGLFFFPLSMRPTKVSNELVEKIIESDSVLKATIGIAELLIFPSNLLPENNQLFHEKYYLWGTLKLRKDTSDEGVTIVGEQNGSVCATAIEEGQLQEQHVLDQQDEVQSESPDQETSAVNLFGNQPILGNNPEAEKKAMATSITGGVILPGSSLCNAKANTPTAGSNSSSSVVHPKEMSLQQGEQDGSVCATEEGQLQEQHALDQQDEVQRESPDQETSAVNLVGSQPMLKNNPEAEKDAMATSMTGGVTLPGSSLSNAKVNTPTAGSNSSSSVVHPQEMNLEQGEQDGSVCATEEEQDDLDRQDEVQRESPGQETSAVKLVGSQQIVEFRPETEKKAMAVSMTGGVTFPGSSLSHAKPNAQTVGSNTTVLHPEEVNLQQEEEGFTSSPIVLFGVNIAQPPRAQPLTQAMVTANSNTGNPGTDHHHPEAFYLNGLGVEPEPPQPAGVVASQAVLELFPVQQEQMEMEMEVEIEIDLELRLAVPSPCNLELQL